MFSIFWSSLYLPLIFKIQDRWSRGRSEPVTPNPAFREHGSSAPSTIVHKINGPMRRRNYEMTIISIIVYDLWVTGWV